MYAKAGIALCEERGRAMKTFILPGSGWSILLPGIMASVVAGDVLLCGSHEMAELARSALLDAGIAGVVVTIEAPALGPTEVPV